jgi:hypothetical protein
MQRSAVAWDAAAMSAMRAVAADKVTGLTLRIHVDHTWANAGGTLRIGASGDTTVPATLPLPSGLAWDITVPHTGWVDVQVPLPIAKKFAAGGTLSGFHFYGARSDSYGYGYLARTAELFLHRTN